jgi:5-methylcytosine-specific restriction endonuclease McrA
MPSREDTFSNAQRTGANTVGSTSRISLVSFHVEHIIATQHVRDDSLENLALACHRCNLHKRTNLIELRLELLRSQFWE